MRCQLRILWGLLISVLAVFLLPVSPLQASPFEVLAGWEGDTHAQGYGYAAVGALIPAGTQLVVPVRVTGSFLYYTFDSSGTSVNVRSNGVSLLTGVRIFGERGSATFLGGGEVRWEHRETGAATPSDETIIGAVLQLDGEVVLSQRWHGFLLANYAGAAQYLYNRAAVRYQATNLEWQRPTCLFFGLEGVYQGNDESTATQGGGFMELVLVPQHISLVLHAGYKESWSPGESHRKGGYLGLGVYRRF